MYLKSIEVHGFKSFANKILFEFHDGITGIVGPNGSGKSNVADAVRWVLGEQSAKQLRGGNMQDVIFSGTERRNPQSYAKVAITLDNSDHILNLDFDEIIVTRKLYRSGESEYLLNNAPCRLKDIQELFYDTGIGKEGYSIIGQGQIDKILSGKPEDRRELFDEAAGIVKFKRRKVQTQKKLESERNNLTRVNDILDELEKRVGPLKVQSDKAKQYLGFKDELKTLDINMFLVETSRINDNEKEFTEKLAILNEDYNNSKEEYNESKEQYEVLENELENLETKIELGKNNLSKTAVLREQIEGQIKVLEEQLKAQDIKDEHFSETTTNIKEEINKREKAKQKILFENKGLKSTLDEAAEEKTKIEKDLQEIKNTIEEKSSRIEAKKQWIIEELNNRASISGNAQSFDVILEQNKKQKAEITRSLIEIKSEEGKLQELMQKRFEDLASISEEIKEKDGVFKAQESDISSFDKTIEKIDNEISEAQRKYFMENSKLTSMKNITERYDGYGSSIRKVMEVKEKEQSIRGVVADIIKTEKKYELAIEIALGGSIQNIVVDDENTGKKMISYLKKNHFGRATFLPLTAVKRREFKEQNVLNENGVIGLADSLVKVKEKYKELASSLLGRVIVTENIDNAIAISKKYNNKFKLVTLEGEVINPGGAMTGGAYKNSSNLLSRRREIEELEKRVKACEDELKEAKNKKEKVINSKNQASKVVITLRDELQKLSLKQKEFQIKLEDSKIKLDNCKNNIENLRIQNETLDNEVEEIKSERLQIEEVLRGSEKEESDANELINIIDKELNVLREKEIELSNSLEENAIKCAQLSQKHQFVIENEKRLNEEIEEYNKQLENATFNNENSDKLREEKKAEIEKLLDSVNQSKELITEIKKEIEENEKQKEETNKKHRSFIEKRENLVNHINELEREKDRLENKIIGLEESLENHVNYMWDEYELTYDSAKELRNEEINDISFMRRRINELKRDIRNLGMVNVNAIDEFKEVGERYEFLKKQHDDLLTAENTLMDIIKELDIGMTKQFKEQFKSINDEYNKVFKSLFGGGNGYLELMDEENILETGIKIVAQPPGKKLQNMMQLSGGEKALTAIALLFAIQNLKPSPFCILDEIEAALDDSNVDKFAEYLHAMTENTQFIVITHRRGTMTSSDRLYGITMQEKGVSTLVSVDLVEGDLTD